MPPLEVLDQQNKEGEVTLKQLLKVVAAEDGQWITFLQLLLHDAQTTETYAFRADMDEMSAREELSSDTFPGIKTYLSVCYIWKCLRSYSTCQNVIN